MIAAGILGLVMGSFLNVCIHRLPRGESVVAPRSRCPHRAAPIRPLDNIPSLSYLVLAGRCRAWGARISPQHPAVEPLTAACFPAAPCVFGLTLHGSLAAALLYAQALMSFVDLEHQTIRHPVTLPGIPLGLVGAMGRQAAPLLESRLPAGLAEGMTVAWRLEPLTQRHRANP